MPFDFISLWAQAGIALWARAKGRAAQEKTFKDAESAAVKDAADRAELVSALIGSTAVFGLTAAVTFVLTRRFSK